MIARAICFALLLLSLLTLSACIEVKDLGGFWARGTVDPALVGKWRQERADGEQKREPTLFSVAIDRGAYSIEMLNKREATIRGRTLKAGHHTYFMSDPSAHSEAILYRYTERQGVLQLYSLKITPFKSWLQKRYPAQNAILFAPLVITALDESVFEILSNIPEDDVYWDRNDAEPLRYRKLP